MTMRGAPATAVIILAACAIELIVSISGARLSVLNDYGFIIDVTGRAVSATFDYSLLTHAALHFNLLHLGFNMAALAAFGPPVERSMGTAGYVAAFLVAAVFGALFHFGWIAGGVALGFAQSPVLLMGASGAISGVLALEFYRRYLFLRMARRQAPDGPSPIGHLLQMSALFVGLNLAISLLPGFISGQAHIGGYFAGLALAPFLMRRPAF